MRTTPLVFKLWIFSYSVVGSRLSWPPLVAASSPQERRALSSCQFTGSSNRPAVDWMTLPYPPAPDALRPGSGAGNGNAVWGLMKDAVRPGCHPWETAGRGESRGTQCGHRLRGHRPAKRKLRCKGKRPACCRCRRAGACETCGAAACVWQLRRSRVGKRPEPAIRSTAW